MEKSIIELQRLDLGAGLYLIATPIGNLRDISIRSLETLNAVDYVACEDTRIYKEILRYWDLNEKKAFPYHQHNEEASSKGLMELIKKGSSIALLSDAGSLNISDPGAKLVDICIKKNIKISSLPGPSALTTAMSLCPYQGPFQFHAFPPKKNKARMETLKDTLGNQAHIFFESAHRINEHLQDALSIFPDRNIMLCKDLTKEKYEKIYYGSIQDLCNDLSLNIGKGEFVLIYMPYSDDSLIDKNLNNFIELGLGLGIRGKDLLKLAQTFSNLDRKEIYKIIEKEKANE